MFSFNMESPISKRKSKLTTGVSIPEIGMTSHRSGDCGGLTTNLWPHFWDTPIMESQMEKNMEHDKWTLGLCRGIIGDCDARLSN